MFRYFFIIFFLGISQNLQANNDLRRILRVLDRGDLEKTLELIQESLEVEEINPGVKWVYARILAEDSLGNYDLDKARILIGESLDDYGRIDIDFKEDLLKVEVDSAVLVETYHQIESQYFQKTIEDNSVSSFEFFMESYPKSEFTSGAVRKRDSLAFLTTKEKNTWQEFQNYFQTYPDSRYVQEARENYHLLLFQSRTSTGQLSDYIDFVENHPTSPFREESIEFIFRYSTLDHDPISFSNFIRQYPEAKEVRDAINFIFYIDRKNLFRSQSLIADDIMDSLVELSNLNEIPIIPVLNAKKIGFMSLEGEWLLQPYFDSVNPEIFCEVIQSDFLFGRIQNGHTIINRKGESIYRGRIFDVKDIGLGGIFINTGSSGLLIHKSGRELASGIQDAGIFADRWYKVKKNGRWALISYTGVLLTEFLYEEIYQSGQFYVFKRGNEIALATLGSLLDELGEGGFTLEYKYDDLEFVSDSLVIGFNGDRECLVDQDLDFVIPWDIHTIYPDPNVFYTKEDSLYRLYKTPDFYLNAQAREVQVSENWVILKNEAWTSINLKNGEITINLDSAKLLNDFALYFEQRDSAWCLFPNGQKILLSNETTLKNLRGGVGQKDFLVIRNEDLSSVWDETGSFYFQGVFENIQALNDSLFRVSFNKNYGIVDKTGYYLLEPRYDFIQVENNLGMLLNDGKIGVYDFKKDALVECAFEATFTRFGNNYKTKQNGLWGIVDPEGNTFLDFQFRDVKYYNDSTAWVKSDSTWAILNINSQKLRYNQYESISEVSTNANKLFRVLTYKGYGMVNTGFGEIINPNFTDIRLIGESDQYFLAEHFVPEADIYVMVAYRLNGEKIYAQALEAQDYERVYCE